MKTMNMQKRILAYLMAAYGISNIDTFGIAEKKTNMIDDFEILEKEFISMKNYEQNGKPIYDAVPEPTEISWAKPAKDLPTASELLALLKNNKKEIFYVLCNQGEEHRKQTFQKGKKRVLASRKIFNALKLNANIKRMENNDVRGPICATWITPDNEKIEKIRNRIDKKNKKKNRSLTGRVISWLTNKKKKTEESSIIRYMSIDPTKDAKENWANIGRGALHSAPKKMESYKTEIKRGAEGTINCTVWATLISWWLNKNGIPAKRIDIPDHELVIVPARSSKDTNRITLYTLEVSENAKNIAEVKFIMKPVAAYLELWTSICITKNGFTNIPGIIFETLKEAHKTKKNSKLEECIKDWTDLYNRTTTIKKDQNHPNQKIYYLYQLPYQNNELKVPINTTVLGQNETKQSNLTFAQCLMTPETYKKYLKGTLKVTDITSWGKANVLLEAEGKKSTEKWAFLDEID